LNTKLIDIYIPEILDITNTNEGLVNQSELSQIKVGARQTFKKC
jgi:hypothetical protein